MKAWALYFGVVLVCCLFCKPLIGFCMGIGIFCTIWYVVFKLLGG
jgi:hypothetical protein